MVTKSKLAADQGSERREHARTPIERPCKAFHRPSRTYMPGRTLNLSPTGAMVVIESPRPLHEGDELEIGIAWDRRVVIESRSMTRARVVRVSATLGKRQAVAVRFVVSGALAVAA
jgi:hypothetical protein